MVTNKLTLKEYVLDDFLLLKEQWEYLQDGHDMTYYQRYSWYATTIVKFRVEDCNKYISRIFIVYNDNIPVLIAPLWLVFRTFGLINKPGVFFLDEKSYSDYGNFIYNRFSSSALELIISYIIRIYKIQYFFFTRLTENTDTYKYLSSRESVDSIKKDITVALKIPQNIEEYHKMLSKNSRQNIRTAFNRIKKDNLNISMFFDDINVDYERCAKLKSQRFDFIVQRDKQYTNIFNKAFDFIRDNFEFNFPIYLPFEHDQEGKIMSLKVNDLTVAFFYYAYDNVQKSIVIMCAGIDDNYKYYSPGICLMYSFITEILSQKLEFKSIDFTRGTEFYKYALGGDNNYIFDVSFDYNKTRLHHLKKHFFLINKKIIKKYLFH